MTHRLKHLFKHQKAFVGYITVGDGGIEQSIAAAKALIAGGVNILELGVPFSDPIADGPVIQLAAQRALENHTTLWDVLNVAQQLRQQTSIPLVLFSYYNPLLHADPKKWLPIAKQAGIDAVLVVDLPYEEGKEFYAECLAHNIVPIMVITPATTPQRLKTLLRYAKGFLYYASRKGTTGMREGLPKDLVNNIAAIKQQTKLPVVVGFGIAKAADAKQILRHADGFVVGSLFVQALAEGVSMQKLTELARGFKYEDL